MHLRVMTYNVRHCRTFWGTVRPEQFAEVIREYNVDIVGLQEMDVNRGRTGHIHQPQRTAEILGMNYAFQPSYREGEVQYGTAVLSRLPLKVQDKERSGKRFGAAEYMRPSINRVEIALDENKILHVVNAHLHWLGGPRKKDVNMILENGWLALHDDKNPMVLLGDFNAGLRGYAYQTLGKSVAWGPHEVRTKPLNTWHSLFPCRSLDHIWVFGAVTIEKIFVARSPVLRVLSDHLPLIADIIV